MLNILNVPNVPMDASSACWSLFQLKSSLSEFKKKTHYRRTDRPTGGPTGRWTDRPYYRDARTHLKKEWTTITHASDWLAAIWCWILSFPRLPITLSQLLCDAEDVTPNSEIICAIESASSWRERCYSQILNWYTLGGITSSRSDWH